MHITTNAAAQHSVPQLGLHKFSGCGCTQCPTAHRLPRLRIWYNLQQAVQQRMDHRKPFLVLQESSRAAKAEQEARQQADSADERLGQAMAAVEASSAAAIEQAQELQQAAEAQVDRLQAAVAALQRELQVTPCAGKTHRRAHGHVTCIEGPS